VLGKVLFLPSTTDVEVHHCAEISYFVSIFQTFPHYIPEAMENFDIHLFFTVHPSGINSIVDETLSIACSADCH
jgi:hypothetical protein